MARTSFTTTIEENIQKEFKSICQSNSKNMNDLLEEFMKHYNEGYTITYSKEVKSK